MACLMVEPFDFSKPLFGNGCVAVDDSAIRCLGSKMAVVGASSQHPLGQWTTIQMHGHTLDFLPVAHAETVGPKAFLSSNLAFVPGLAKYLPKIRERGVQAVFTQTYTVLWYFVYARRHWDVCFYYPGLANPLLIGKRRTLGRWLAGAYERIQAKAIGRAGVAFGPASQEVVDEYNQKLARRGITKRVHHVPNAVNLEVFKPGSMELARQAMGLPLGVPIYVFVGRLASVKGIPLLFEGLKCVRRREPGALLLVAGDGEEREKLRQLAGEMGLGEAVRFLGKCAPEKIAHAVNSANASLCGSYAEGISVAMIEQIACGRPVVSTAVSGARDMIQEGKNGYILASRDPELFGQRMLDVLQLKEASSISRRLAEAKYSEQALWRFVADQWPPLQQ